MTKRADGLSLRDKTDFTDKTPAAIWTVPASRMKAEWGHRAPLTAEALAILQSLPRLEGCPYVFFAPRGGQLSDMALSAVMRRMQEAEEKAGADVIQLRAGGGVEP